MIWFFLRNVFNKPKPDEYKSGIDAIVGHEAKVIEEINHEKGTGRIKIYGDEFTVALQLDMSVIPEGQTVRIERIEGNKVYIKE